MFTFIWIRLRKISYFLLNKAWANKCLQFKLCRHFLPKHLTYKTIPIAEFYLFLYYFSTEFLFLFVSDFKKCNRKWKWTLQNFCYGLQINNWHLIFVFWTQKVRFLCFLIFSDLDPWILAPLHPWILGYFWRSSFCLHLKISVSQKWLPSVFFMSENGRSCKIK